MYPETKKAKVDEECAKVDEEILNRETTKDEENESVDEEESPEDADGPTLPHGLTGKISPPFLCSIA